MIVWGIVWGMFGDRLWELFGDRWGLFGDSLGSVCGWFGVCLGIVWRMLGDRLGPV